MLRTPARLLLASPCNGRSLCLLSFLIVLLFAVSLPSTAQATDPQASAVPIVTSVPAVQAPEASVPNEPTTPIKDAPVDTDSAAAASTVKVPIGRGHVLGMNRIPEALTGLGLLAIPLDHHIMSVFPHSGGKSDSLTETVNRFGTPTILLPAIGGLYLLGDGYEKDTAKMALAALINSAGMTAGLKFLAGRGRPSTGIEAGEFEGLEPDKGPGFSSFPSGHTSAAFAVATVLANRHPKHKWLYYALAGAVGVARIRKSEHFPSDVLVGAGLGIFAGNDAVTHGPRLFSIRIKL